MRTITIILATVLAGLTCSAQSPTDTTAVAIADSTVRMTEAAVGKPEAAVSKPEAAALLSDGGDATARLTDWSAWRPDPKRALWLALVIPGGGQIYNHQYWKVPVIYGAFVGMGYLIHYYYDRMTTFRDEYLFRVNHNDTPNLPNYANYPRSNIYSLYNSYNRNFQLMVIITVGIYALNLIDAYVFGHLFDFRIDDDISLNVMPSFQPTPIGLQPTLGLTFCF